MKKLEILRSSKDISNVFESKDTVTLFSKIFCIKYLEVEGAKKTLITIPSKKFKKAVDRNRLKRQIKDIYSKIGNYDNKHVVIIFSSKEKVSYSEMSSSLMKMFKKLV